MLANVQQKTIKPLFEKFVKAGSMVNTDEYVIYDRLEAWGYGHVSVNHSAGEFARDADDDGVFEVHVNTLEGFWSLLRSWLRVHHVPRVLHDVESLRSGCRCIWAFLGWFITCVGVVGHCWDHYWRCCWCQVPAIHKEPSDLRGSVAARSPEHFTRVSRTPRNHAGVTTGRYLRRRELESKRRLKPLEVKRPTRPKQCKRPVRPIRPLETRTSRHQHQRRLNVRRRWPNFWPPHH